MKQYYPTIEAQHRLAEYFDLPWDKHSAQDWGIIVADLNRVTEFATAIPQFEQPDVQVCLLGLVLASLDDWLSEEQRSPEEIQHQWSSISSHLVPLAERYQHITDYWMRDHRSVGPVLKQYLRLDQH